MNHAAMVMILSFFFLPVQAIGIRNHTSPSEKASWVRSEAFVEQAAECVWSVAKDPEKFPDFIPRLSKSTRLEKIGSKERFFVVLNPPFPFKEIAHVLEVEFDDSKKRVRWAMIEGNILKNEGTVRLTQVGAQTKVDMEIQLDMGGSWPKFMVTWGVRYYLPKVIEGFRKRATAFGCPGRSSPETKKSTSPNNRTRS